MQRQAGRAHGGDATAQARADNLQEGSASTEEEDAQEEEPNAELLQQNINKAEVEMHAPVDAPSNKRARAEDGDDERRKKTKRSKRKRKREVIDQAHAEAADSSEE